MLRCLLATGLTMVSLIASANAQVATGSYPYGTFDNRGIDSINVGNLNVHLTIPVLNKPGRGIPFFYNLTYDSSAWSLATVSGSPAWNPALNWGWRGQTEAATGYVSYATLVTHGAIKQGEPVCTLTTYSDFTYHDTLGVNHPFIGASTDNSQNCSTKSSSTATASATDGSGYTLNVTGYTSASLTTIGGRVINPPTNNAAGNGTITDANGNQLNASSGGVFTDTLGQTALSIAGQAPNNQTLTYTDTTRTARAVTIAYRSYTVQTAFGCSGVAEYGPLTNSLVNTITFADGSAYQFSYEATPGASGSVTGRIASVTLRTGGTVSYTYTGGNKGIICTDGSAAGLTRALSATGGSAASTTTYVRSSITATSSHTDVADGATPANHTTYDFAVPSSFTAFYETNRAVYNGGASGTPALSRNICYNGASSPCTTTAVTLPIAQVDTYETLDGAQQHGTTSKYNTYGLQTEQDTYDYGGASTRGALLSKEVWSYPSNGIVSLLSSDTVSDGSGNQISQTIYAYDETTGTGHEALVTTSGLPQHGGAVGTQRGNQTTVSQWVNTTGAVLSTASSYDDTGQVRASQDPKGNKTTYTYDSATNAFLSTINYPTPSSGVAISTGAQYDSGTGVLLSTTDPNGQVTSYKSYDALLRVGEVDYPDGGRTTYSYTPTEVSTSQLRQGSNSIISVVDADVYGRLSQITLDDPAGNDLLNYTYDGNGNVKAVTNPHRSASSSTDGTTTSIYDALGRVTSQTQPDGSTKRWTYSGNTVTLANEVNSQWKQTVDGLGRLTAVLEPGAASSPPTIETDYGYSVLTATVTQKGVSETPRVRTFTTDSLGRTLTAITPEAGVTSYGYDSNSNLIKRTDARNITTTYSYDALNRLVCKSFSDGTPSECFGYDVSNQYYSSSTNLKGRLYWSSSPYRQAKFFSYDAMGRLSGQGYSLPSDQGTTEIDAFSAKYDLAGNMTDLWYPDGRHLTQGWNNAAHLTNVTYADYAGQTVQPPNYQTALSRIRYLFAQRSRQLHDLWQWHDANI